MKLENKYIIFLLLTVFFLGSCDDEIVLIGEPVTELSNDAIKRSLPVAPNLVGEVIEFAYAMALPETLGTLSSAEVTATFAGASGTYFDPNSYHTNESGADVPVLVAAESQISGKSTTIQFTADTCAATLRYYYVIPEEARNKEVSFTFSVKASNGQTAKYDLGPYKVSKMHMTLNQVVNEENSYISFQNAGEAMTIYSRSELDADPSLVSKIDLVYYHHNSQDISHAFYTAGAPTEYHPGLVLPNGLNNQTKLIKEYGLRDRQLSNLQYTHFVDDLDLIEINMNRSTNYILGLKEEAGVWVETSDAKYRAFVFVNRTSSGEMTISAKRIEM